ncbi:MAG TPA: YkgJ family cysteine cluster protein [Gallionellaceae bacterium]|nr:YkgJ family cysteine cluster protein [Gallionellaceae bacterium]
MSESLCLSCGACCAHFRVSFYWGEADDAPGGHVPAHLTEQVHAHLRCMQGTSSNPPRCVALSGEVGRQVACNIYELRPSPCREFNVFEEDGTPNERCNKLRTQVGLV